MGPLSDLKGRRLTTVLACLHYALGALLCALAPGVWLLVVGRVLLGVGRGLHASADIFISEMAPSPLRGRYSQILQIVVPLGSVVGCLLPVLLEGQWRLLFLVTVLPPLLELAGLLCFPESPQWLFKEGRRAEALAALRLSYTESPEAQAELSHEVELME